MGGGAGDLDLVGGGIESGEGGAGGGVKGDAGEFRVIAGRGVLGIDVGVGQGAAGLGEAVADAIIGPAPGAPGTVAGGEEVLEVLVLIGAVVRGVEVVGDGGDVAHG